MKRIANLVSFLLLGLQLLVTAQAEIREVTYLHTDGLGSPVVATDENGQVKWREQYLPYGDRQASSSANTADVGYTGHFEQADIGLTYAGARWYDPEVGRFLSLDNVRFVESNPMSFNRYAYASHNPYKYVDPDGNVIETAWDAFNVGIGVASFTANAAAGNYIGASLDALGIVVDGAAVVLPGVPGGAGSAIKAARYGDEVVSAVAKGADDIFKAGRTPKASELKKYAEGQGWKPTQTEGGPIKYVDENEIPRVTIKQGSSRAPGSGNPHVELKDATGQRIDPAGNPVTRKSPGNHTPIDYDL